MRWGAPAMGGPPRRIWPASRVENHGRSSVSAGQRADSPQITAVVEAISVPGSGPGRSRNRPDCVLADKAYSSAANRTYLRTRGICATIPAKADQAANQKRKGSSGWRPTAFDVECYKQRHAVECGINQLE
ncbi:transposase [Rhodococcus sp. NPDC057014]|uniref:transposase n=1 Tax=Rhodococcus sp. NPDC057014 TaxID=3346000 RepID=UPI003629F036